jgi:hypothetical protein
MLKGVIVIGAVIFIYDMFRRRTHPVYPPAN